MGGSQRHRAAVVACSIAILALLGPSVFAQKAAAPATTYTTMAEQVAALSMFPNGPGSQKAAVVAPAPNTAQQTGNTQFQSTGGSTSGQQQQPQQQQQQPQQQQQQQQQPSASTAQVAQTGNPNPNMPPRPPQPTANGPAADPQAALNTIGSVVNAAGSLASAQQALGTASTAAASGDVLQTVGSAAQALQAVQKAASDVGSAGKALQTGGASASPIPVATPSPPTININIPGLGGNGGTQGPPGISYSAPATNQAATQAVSYGAPATTTGGSTGGSDPLATIGSALAQAAFGGGLAQPAAAAQNTATFQSKAGRRMI